MNKPQPGILLSIPSLARYLSFTLLPGANPRGHLHALRDLVDGERTVLGLGLSLASALDTRIDGLRMFPQHAQHGLDIPSTPAAVWLWLRGEDRGELLHRSRALEKVLAGAFHPGSSVDAFQYDGGRDLSGYIDGTENPNGGNAARTAIVHGATTLTGSSFVAVQQWEHSLDRFEAMTPEQQDHTIGRRKTTNEELADAPASAHVKRAAQESFDPAAFVVRRSMPWADATRAGLMFTAFGTSFDAFEALLNRMAGGEDGITDALFRFTHPVSGAYFWCPGMRGNRIDLAPLGL